MFDQFSGKQLVKIFALTAFGSVFVALFIYFALFPVNHNDLSKVVESKTVIGVDPIAFEIAKTWNNINPGIDVIDIDSCNKATRLEDYAWRVELKAC